jgi:hypothetical protein
MMNIVALINLPIRSAAGGNLAGTPLKKLKLGVLSNATASVHVVVFGG